MFVSKKINASTFKSFSIKKVIFKSKVQLTRKCFPPIAMKVCLKDILQLEYYFR